MSSARKGGSSARGTSSRKKSGSAFAPSSSTPSSSSRPKPSPSAFGSSASGGGNDGFGNFGNSSGGSGIGGGGGGSSSRPGGTSSSSSKKYTSSSRDRGSSRNASGSSFGSSMTSSSGGKVPPQEGLMEIVKKRFVKDVFESSSAAHPGWKVLIVDDGGMKAISHAVGMYDIMERQVSIVESIDKKRAPFKDMPAIYILSPTKDSVKRLINDYSDKSKILYGSAVFVYFLGPIPNKLLDEIKQCKYLIKRLKALSEVNVDFLVEEQRAFVLDMNTPFSNFFVRSGMSQNESLIADKLVTVCATLNEYPYIRYKSSSGICNSLASVFKLKMDEFVGNNPTWWYHGSGRSPQRSAERERSSFLLLDRTSDCLTPLMHDFTYQAMVHDLLDMDGNKITYKAETAEDPTKQEDKDVLLNEKDKLWVELRGNHIAQVIETLSARINEVVNSSTNSAVHKGSGSNMSLSQLASALKELPEYREVMSKLSQHMHLAHECMDKFNQGGLLDLSDVEQTLATGKDEDGRSPKLSETISRCEAQLMRMRDSKERLRLVLIATISQNGLTSADRDRLIRAAQLSRDELLTVDALNKIGIATINNMMGGSSAATTSFFGSLKGRVASSGSFDDEESEYASSRYNPPLKVILKDLVSNQLDMDEYPSVIPMPASAGSSVGTGSARRRGADSSARKKNDKWGKTGSSSTAQANGSHYVGGRNIVFMVGGLSYSELKVTRDIMQKESREIIAGSTKFIGPSDFLSDLFTLSE
eukprot:CAMPEP_0113485950 /NCGR_PEP_ID=MMETSP0014_2-20120614/24745_1 /TAXON_ID=2857 /ORGANISM="Nitzschia sp." /LENGTH=756 /DNA_ID=CAMNT_0000379607 /DNA_START=146 /DNA_END=2416 /DNA_ORIENTATION=+ /assembly_acc=CAM_ASM_000159